MSDKLSKTFVWDGVHDAALRQFNDEERAVVEADKAVTLLFSRRRRIILAVPMIRLGLRRMRIRLPRPYIRRGWLIAGLVGLAVTIFSSISLASDPAPYAGVSKDDALVLGDGDAQTWFIQNSELQDIERDHKGSAEFWRLDYLGPGGAVFCVYVAKEVYYVQWVGDLGDSCL